MNRKRVGGLAILCLIIAAIFLWFKFPFSGIAAVTAGSNEADYYQAGAQESYDIYFVRLGEGK